MNRPTRIILGFSVQQLYRGLRSCDQIPSKPWHFALAKFALIAFKTATISLILSSLLLSSFGYL